MTSQQSPSVVVAYIAGFPENPFYHSSTTNHNPFLYDFFSKVLVLREPKYPNILPFKGRVVLIFSDLNFASRLRPGFIMVLLVIYLHIRCSQDIYWKTTESLIL